VAEVDEQPTGWNAVRSEIATRMTAEHAATVERLRVEQELTWRGVAEVFDDEFPRELYDPSLRGNQGVGMFLCEVAAEVLRRPVD
jgi:hypothetical protein